MSEFDRNSVINVGLFGCGNIGTGVVKFFQEGKGIPHNIELKSVVVQDLSKPRGVSFPFFTNDPEKVIYSPKIDIVVELMGGIDPTKMYLLDAIYQRKSIVTANKAVLAKHMDEIFEAARSHDVDVGYEASVAGGIQILDVLRRLKGETKTSIVGIVNGTDNYILTKMTREGWDFKTSLEDAQEKGFAEKDPFRDIKGLDAQDKLAVLASVAWNTKVDVNKIACRGIDEITDIDIAYAKELGYTIKLLAIAKRENENVSLRVTPALIDTKHPLADCHNEYNKIFLDGTLAGQQTFSGKGAGEKPTTSAVISDIIHIADNIRRGKQDPLPTLDSLVNYSDPLEINERGYIRASLLHIPWSFNRASAVIARRGLNMIDSIQRRDSARNVDGHVVMEDIITFEPAPYKAIYSALEGLKKCKRVYGTPVFLPIIDLPTSG